MDSRLTHPTFSTPYGHGSAYGLPMNGGLTSGSLFRDMPLPRGHHYTDRPQQYGSLLPDRYLRTSPPPGYMGGPPAYLPPSRKFRTKVRFDFCVFCRNNGEDEQFFLAHTLKDDSGQVICPVLRAYVCPICGASGPVAHTIKYCPQNKDDKYHDSYASITTLKQMRSSTGKIRCNGSLSLQYPAVEHCLGPVGSRVPNSKESSPTDSPPPTPGIYTSPLSLGFPLRQGFGSGSPIMSKNKSEMFFPDF
ncbi:hypothetical protein TCAL_04154 [Tigriopus californicus]|uniref:Nanos-type domain-containing protein n=1 Tax=Tigriopus californicus TaxID=6832 RepID=A0A553NU80_TIGCA|nr:uncharacterized protein LOC131888565 [Tigriopus californicus]TRY68988.1 hypothetical protein TCAL_04154 [Tigriopus californicus]|eukprot:TCALIF_04154-PA protein Name:"Similar to nanos1 Nanos homolog 1 (Danio rerio)" AED:0.00 eAED:0.00 QI:185/1/1/1/1/1/2/330/247